mgnify:CR=1 FL=1
MIQQIFHTAFPVLLAPLAGVTDLPYRRLCRELGCDFTYTEMVSAKGLRYGAAATAAEDRCTIDHVANAISVETVHFRSSCIFISLL